VTLAQIASDLAQTRLRSPRGKGWSERTIANILRNPVYTTGITKAGIRCPAPIPNSTWQRANKRLDMEKGGRMGSVDEPLRKIVYCGSCGTAMKLRTKKLIRQYVCNKCNQVKEEAWIMQRAIGQTKRDLKWILKDVAIRLGTYNVLQKSNELKNRIDIVLCDYQKIETGDKKELIRMLKNYVSFELGKKLSVYSDRVIVQGMTIDEVMTELELGDTDWLAYAYKSICANDSTSTHMSLKGR
jgi:hypothetical protein